MQNVERPSTLIVVVVTLVLAGIVGVVVPLASGSKPGREQVAWSSPTPAPPTEAPPTNSATETAPPRPTQTVTHSPSATPTSRPPTVTRTVDLTPTSTQQVQATQSPSPTATQRAPATPTPPASSSGRAFVAMVAVDLLNLRGGPGQGFGVVGLARAGETYTVTSRSEDGAWLQICCVNQAPAWLASGMVTVTSTIDSLPIAP